MPKTNRGDEEKRRNRVEPPKEVAGRRSSPGSGEDEDEPADLQPEDVENGDPAR